MSQNRFTDEYKRDAVDREYKLSPKCKRCAVKTAHRISKIKSV